MSMVSPMVIAWAAAHRKLLVLPSSLQLVTGVLAACRANGADKAKIAATHAASGLRRDGRLKVAGDADIRTPPESMGAPPMRRRQGGCQLLCWRFTFPVWVAFTMVPALSRNAGTA
jgi:hypothetical protein